MRQYTGLLGSALLCTVLLGGSALHAAQPDSPNVTIDNFTFTPAEINVSTGTKVLWENRDDIPHTVTDAAEKRAFKSPALDTGDKFSYAFTTPGTYHYFCSLHPHMQGTVVVK